MRSDRIAKYKRASILSLFAHDLNSEVYQLLINGLNQGIYQNVVDTKLEVLSFFYRQTNQNIFELDLTVLQKKMAALAHYVLLTMPDTDFIQKTGDTAKINITRATLLLLKQITENLFDVIYDRTSAESKTYTKNAAAMQLLSCLIGLRLYTVIKKNHIPYPSEDISEQKAKDDFDRLQSDILKMMQQRIESVVFTSRSGRHAIDKFTKKERIMAGTTQVGSINGSCHHYSSPHDVWYTETNRLANNLRKVIIGWYKQFVTGKDKISITKENDGITNASILVLLESNELVSQFPPLVVANIIAYLKTMHGFEIINGSVFDPCAGWAGRLLGALAHPEIFYYVGVEPNPRLCPNYLEMKDFYIPEKNAAIFNARIEQLVSDNSDISLLKPFRIEHDLIITSPPYRDVELYPDTKDRYKDDTNWGIFLQALIASSRALRPGGIIAINIGNIKRYNLPNDVETTIQSMSFLCQISLLNPSRLNCSSQARSGPNKGTVHQSKELFIFARRQAIMGTVPLPIAGSFEVTKSIKRTAAEAGLNSSDGSSFKRPRL